MIFIQDSLKFKSYPANPDTFYFEKAVVKQNTQKGRRMMEVILMNRNYFSHNYYDITDNVPLEIKIYKEFLSLNADRPVLAEINLQDVRLSEAYGDVKDKVFCLYLNINSIKNVQAN